MMLKFNGHSLITYIHCFVINNNPLEDFDFRYKDQCTCRIMFRKSFINGKEYLFIMFQHLDEYPLDLLCMKKTDNGYDSYPLNQFYRNKIVNQIEEYIINSGIQLKKKLERKFDDTSRKGNRYHRRNNKGGQGPAEV